MSLSKIRKITEEGVKFQSHLDGSRHMLSPERSIEVQCLLGSDIQMQFDECIELPAERKEVERAMLSAALGRAIEARVRSASCKRRRDARAGAVRDCAGRHGYRIAPAVGGSARRDGFSGLRGRRSGGRRRPRRDDRDALETLPHLPTDKPRYLMGVGTPLDLIEAVRRGVDMFDCVMPTRNGRHGYAFTWDGPLNMRNAKHAEDLAPLDPISTCPAAHDYSRAYVHHLIKSGEYLGAMILSWVNTVFYQDLMAAMRLAIAEGRFQEVWPRKPRHALQSPGQGGMKRASGPRLFILASILSLVAAPVSGVAQTAASKVPLTHGTGVMRRTRRPQQQADTRRAQSFPGVEIKDGRAYRFRACGSAVLRHTTVFESRDRIC